jgi:phenylacetate-CoA ligase
MVATYGWWWRRRRFGSTFRRLVSEWRSHEQWTADEFTAAQTVDLAAVLQAAAGSPYYRRLFQDLRITADTPPREALRRLPTLSKETLRLRARDLLTGPPPRDAVTFRSSGTTGTPTEIYYTRAFHAVEMAAIEARNLNWAGLSVRDRRVMFGARKVCRVDQRRPPFWRFSPSEDLAYASIYHLGPEFLPAYTAFLRDFQPAVVMGYPSSLYAVAAHSLETGDALPPAGGVFTSAERLTDSMRTAIETAWQCRVFDRYGAVEGCVAASQCEHGRYHVSPEVGIVELLDPDGHPVPPGVEGEVVCTGLQNTLQPLIRYRIGDYARWALVQRCPCGRAMPILEGIDGRVEDCCYTPDGRQVIRFDTVFKGVANIRLGQVVQEAADAFTIVVVPTPDFNARDEATLARNMRLHVGAVRVAVTCVDDIPRTSAGKFRAVVCRLSAEEQQRCRTVSAASASSVRR